MVITTYGKSIMAQILGENIGYIAIGSGSGTALASQTTLLAERIRNATTSIDTSEAQKVKIQGDFTASQMSGTKLMEFGLFNQSSGGSVIQRVGFGSLTFDGSLELQILSTLHVI